MSEKENKNRLIVIKTIALIILIVAIGIVIWLLTARHETHISTTTGSSDYRSLECSAAHPDDPFFAPETAQKISHDVSILFTDDNLKEISYRFEGVYNTEEKAEFNKVKMHADYDKYMVSGGLNQEILNPVFSIDKTKVRISLYAEAKKVNSVVARLFFMTGDDFEKISEFKPEDYRKMYESKGFTCKLND